MNKHVTLMMKIFHKTGGGTPKRQCTKKIKTS
jgi:hypothetical protein